MWNRFSLGVVAGIAAVLVACVVGGYIAIANGAVPANADAKPGRFERWAARKSLNATMRREARPPSSELPATDANLTAGLKLYAQNCAVCHGDASAKPTNIAKGFYQKAPQLAEDGVERDPAGVVYWKITHGIRFTAMPAFSKTLTDVQRAQVVLFVQHMDKLPAPVDGAWHKVKS